jgi:hypothetical protein
LASPSPLSGSPRIQKASFFGSQTSLPRPSSLVCGATAQDTNYPTEDAPPVRCAIVHAMHTGVTRADLPLPPLTLALPQCLSFSLASRVPLRFSSFLRAVGFAAAAAAAAAASMPPPRTMHTPCIPTRAVIPRPFCTLILHAYSARSFCTLTLHAHSTRSLCTLILHAHSARSLCTLILLTLHAYSARSFCSLCTLTRHHHRACCDGADSPPAIVGCC